MDKTLLTWWSGASLYDWTGGGVDKAMTDMVEWCQLVRLDWWWGG